jgi:hypothetical protein
MLHRKRAKKLISPSPRLGKRDVGEASAHAPESDEGL